MFRKALDTKSKIHGCVQKPGNAESVGQCQPRVCFETLGSKMPGEIVRNPERVARLCGKQTPAQLLQSCAFEKWDVFSQGCQSATLGWNWRTPSAYSSPISLLK